MQQGVGHKSVAGRSSLTRPFLQFMYVIDKFRVVLTGRFENGAHRDPPSGFARSEAIPSTFDLPLIVFSELLNA